MGMNRSASSPRIQVGTSSPMRRQPSRVDGTRSISVNGRPLRRMISAVSALTLRMKSVISGMPEASCPCLKNQRPRWKSISKPSMS